ncbi:MAG: hypothetical protein Kow0074_01170 [Candidatus Zixiibacteriota bacterium]
MIMTRRHESHVLLLMITAMLIGCANPFSPPDVGPTGGSPIKPLDSPENVLENLQYAYEQRDYDVYEELLDKDFRFVYFDPERVEGIETVIVPRDGPSGDLERTRRLFRVFDEIRLPVFEIVEASIDSTPTSPLQQRRVAFQLTVRDLDGDFDFEAFEATGDARFTFQQSPTDRLWRIVRWEDLSNQ